jgi:hypothetical protein
MRHQPLGCLVVAMAVLLAGPASAFARCSLNTVRGAWAFQARGTVMTFAPGSPVPVPVPFVSLGVMRVDPRGAYTLRADLSVGGQVRQVDTTGTIGVLPDCTATVSLPGGAARMMLLERGQEIRLMATESPLGPSAGIAYLRRLARDEPRCTKDMVRGVYGGSAEGTFMVPVPGLPQPFPTPFSGLFVQTFRGDGSGHGTATASMGGAIYEVEFPEFAMDVDADCVATLRYQGFVNGAPEPSYGTIRYIVLANGDELMGMEVESSTGLPLELESHRRISAIPR